MSDEIHYIRFSKGALILDIRFEGDDYETASVKFKLEARDGRPTLDESPAIPIRALFDLAYLISMSIRRTTLEYGKDVQEMQDNIAKQKHPFESIGGNDGKKDKKK